MDQQSLLRELYSHLQKYTYFLTKITARENIYARRVRHYPSVSDCWTVYTESKQLVNRINNRPSCENIEHWSRTCRRLISRKPSIIFLSCLLHKVPSTLILKLLHYIYSMPINLYNYYDLRETPCALRMSTLPQLGEWPRPPLPATSNITLALFETFY